VAKIPYPNGLAACMARAGITDPKLAEAAGTTKQQIHKLRHGERKLTVQWAKRLAPKLDCTWQELIEGPSEPDDPQRVALFVAYNSLDQRDRDTLLRVAESLRRDDPPATPVPPRERAPPPRPTRGGSGAKNVECGDAKNVVLLAGAGMSLRRE
jgi:transcriptional regulator with XRE-family HTH domain